MCSAIPVSIFPLRQKEKILLRLGPFRLRPQCWWDTIHSQWWLQWLFCWVLSKGWGSMSPHWREMLSGQLISTAGSHELTQEVLAGRFVSSPCKAAHKLIGSQENSSTEGPQKVTKSNLLLKTGSALRSDQAVLCFIQSGRKNPPRWSQHNPPGQPVLWLSCPHISVKPGLAKPFSLTSCVHTCCYINTSSSKHFQSIKHNK